MALTKGQKDQIIGEFATHEGDTGSSQVQIALLTTRVQQLTEHMKNHPTDQHSRRGLIKAVSLRRRHLRYLSETNTAAYAEILQRLGLRR